MAGSNLRDPGMDACEFYATGASRVNPTRATEWFRGRAASRGGPSHAGRLGAPAQFVAERTIETVTGEADHRERRLAPADDHAVARLDGNLELAVDHQEGRSVADRDQLEDPVAGVEYP